VGGDSVSGFSGAAAVGKSTLIGMMARNTGADLTVLGLVGERGAEVRDFLETLEWRLPALLRSGFDLRSSPPLLRIRAALAATAVAEYFCARGRQVLLVVDSLTRLAMAQARDRFWRRANRRRRKGTRLPASPCWRA